VTGLADFLLARIAEDERAAADEAVARAHSGTVVLGPAYDDHPAREAIREQLQESVTALQRVRPWTAIYDPARVLAECEAKRKIVEQVRDPAWSSYAVRDLVLGNLALPYADHPDYREEWRP